MKEYSLNINTFWNGDTDIWEFKMEVPDIVTTDEIEKELISAHRYLDKYHEDTYGTYKKGRSAVTLLDYVCEKNGWKWKDFKYDIYLDLN